MITSDYLTDVKTNSENVDNIYVFSFYEKLFPRRFINLKSTSRNSLLILASVFAYIGLLCIYYFISIKFGKYITIEANYDMSAMILATLIFWPSIIIYDNELFFRTYREVRPLFKDKKNSDKWYQEIVKKYYGFEMPHLKRDILLTLVSIFLIIFTIFYFFQSSQCTGLISKHLVLWTPIIVSGGCLLFTVNSKNLSIVLFVINCGLVYYSYVFEYAEKSIQPYFIHSCFTGNLLLFTAVILVFFVAGTTIYPMMGMFKTFYMKSFEEQFDYPITSLSCALNKISKIKSYFLHLTGITLLAYFQLLGTVYTMNLLDGRSRITIILFVVASLFPLMMNLSANVFFKKLCNKIYCKQVEKIDIEIGKKMGSGDMGTAELQTLISLKEMYAEEFEVHTELNKDILIAMLTPLITTILAVFFPILN